MAWELSLERLAEEISKLKEAVRDEIRADGEDRYHAPRRPHLGDIDDPNKGGWLPRNYNRNYTNQRQDVPVNGMCPIYEDGLYRITLSATTKILDSSASNSFSPKLSFNQVGVGSAILTVTIDLTSSSGSGSTTSIDVQLLAGSNVNIEAVGSNLTVGQYNLLASVQKEA